MQRIILFLTTIFIVTTTQSAVIYFLCPDGSIMRQGTICAPEKGCHSVGVYFYINETKIPADLANDGSILIDDAFLNKKVMVESGDNFWRPSYCQHISRAGHLFSTFILQKHQTIKMSFHAYY